MNDILGEIFPRMQPASCESKPAGKDTDASVSNVGVIVTVPKSEADTSPPSSSAADKPTRSAPAAAPSMPDIPQTDEEVYMELLERLETAAPLVLMHLDRRATHSWLSLCNTIRAVLWADEKERSFVMRGCFERWHPHHAADKGFKALLDAGNVVEAFAAHARVGGAPLLVPRNVPKFTAAIGTGHDWDEHRFDEQTKRMKMTNGMQPSDLEDIFASLSGFGPDGDPKFHTEAWTPKHPVARPWLSLASKRSPIYCDDRLGSFGGSGIMFIAVWPGQGPVLVNLDLNFGHLRRGAWPLRFDQDALKKGKLCVFFDCFYNQKKYGKVTGITGEDTKALYTLGELRSYVQEWLDRWLVQDELKWRCAVTGRDSNGFLPRPYDC